MFPEAGVIHGVLIQLVAGEELVSWMLLPLQNPAILNSRLE